MILNPAGHEASRREHIDSLVRDLAAVVGPEHVHTTSARGGLASVEERTTPWGERPAITVRPSNAEEVGGVLTAAHERGVRYRTVSGGKNWGYTDALVDRTTTIRLDLSRMRRIVEIDEGLAYAVVEPGVTFGDLHARLMRSHPELMMDCPGAGPLASIIGNLCERGFGHTELGDRSRHVCDLQVVTARGEVMELGLGGYGPNTRARSVTNHGLGPGFQDAFLQSELGVVTRATVWLMRRPRHFVAMFARTAVPHAHGALVEAVRELRMEGTIRSTAHIFNAMRLSMGASRYPTHLDGTVALECDDAAEARELMRDQVGQGWAVSLSIGASTTLEMQARVARARGVFKDAGCDSVVTLSASRRRWLRRLSNAWPNAKSWRWMRDLDTLGLGLDLLTGVPRAEALAWVDWRARRTPRSSNEDPCSSAGGLIWVAPLLPATAGAAREVVEITRRTAHEFGFEYQVALTALSERALVATVGIAFHKACPDESARAEACHDTMLERLLAGGYVPYRASYRGRQRVGDRNSLHARMKQALCDSGRTATRLDGGTPSGDGHREQSPHLET